MEPSCYRILFEGDSVTDAGRDRSDAQSLSGYNRRIAQLLPHCECVNRAISGSHVAALSQRIDEEILQLRPDCVNLLIGVNDARTFENETATGDEAFRDCYRALLARIRPLVRTLIVTEPFLTSEHSEPSTRAELDRKLEIVRGLAAEFADCFVPTEEPFAKACRQNPDVKYTEDGIHPTPAGHALIAREWLQAAERLLPRNV